jgi:hypothetical protein
MSHNLYTINNAGGDVVSYHGFSRGVIYIGHGEDEAYQATTYAVGDIVEFYDSTPINSIDSATFTKRAGTNWIQKINLPAGTYFIQAYTLFPNTAGHTSRYEFYKNDGTETSIFEIQFFGRDSSSFDGSAQEVQQMSEGVFVLSATSDVYFKIGSISAGTPTSAGNRQSKSNFIMIRRLA